MKIISLKNIFSRTTGQFLLIGLLSLSACKDEPARLTGNVLPEGEVLQGWNYNEHVLSTINTTRNQIKTSQATSGVIGTFNDPVFGKSKGSFVTDFSIGAKVKHDEIHVVFYKIDSDSLKVIEDVELSNQFNNNGVIVETPTDWFEHEKWKAYEEIWAVDSLVLSLQYQFNDWYGDMRDEQKISIYEVDMNLGSSGTEYYHDYNVSYHPTALRDTMLHPNCDVPIDLRSNKWASNVKLWEDPDSLLSNPEYLWDVVKIKELISDEELDEGFDDHQQSTKYWNIKLNEGIDEKIFNLSSADLVNTFAFKEKFNGLFIDSDGTSTVEGGLTKVKLPLGSGLTLHYHRIFKSLHEDVSGNDSMAIDTTNYTYNFPINVENVRFNTYDHPDLGNIVTDDPEPETLYLQGMAGSYSQMEFPVEIMNWVDSLENTDPYISVSNIEFFMEIDTMSLVSDDYDHPNESDPDKVRAIQRYPIPQNLSIVWQDDKGEFVTPTYSIIVSGQKITTPLFGSNANQNGQRSGTGELIPRHIFDDDNNYLRTEYLYHFIMRADFFNYIMRNEEGAFLDTKKFFIGPGDNSTANFKRVALFGGSHPDKPMEMNIKYFHYIPR